MRVTTGPFAGLEGTVDVVLFDTQQVRVVVSVGDGYGYAPFDLEWAQVEKR